MKNNLIIRALLIIGALLFLFLVITGKFFKMVEPGQRAVSFKTMGKERVDHEIRRPGWYYVAPWERFYIIDLQQQSSSAEYQALTRSGAGLELGVECIFQPIEDSLMSIFHKHGTDVEEKLVRPVVGLAVANAIEQIELEALFGEMRSGTLDSIRSEVQAELAANGVRLENIAIRKIVVEEQLQESVVILQNEKVQLQSAQLRLERQRLEAESNALTGLKDSTDSKRDSIHNNTQ